VADSRITQHQPWHREAMGKVFNRLVRLLVVGGFRDTQCGFKLIDGPVARELFAAMVIDRFAFDVELVWLALRRGYRVREVGVEWRDSPQSRVHPLRDSSRMFFDLLRIRWNHRREPRTDRAASPTAGNPGAAR
jgi:dolichyl-phosphate beta-glucosyltransferase